jgi:hypothetical protein
MTEIIEAGCAFLLMLASTDVRWRLQRALPDHHRNRDSIASMRLVITMLITFSALVLGLLTSSAKNRFDAQVDALASYSVSLIELDQRMREFGPETAPMRPELRSYVAAAIADTWPKEPPPTGNYPTFAPSGAAVAENHPLGAILFNLEKQLDTLSSADPRQSNVGDRLRSQMERVLDQRWRVVAPLGSTISWPFFSVLLFWITIIFASFGLSSQRNPTLYATILLCAMLIASSLYLILDYETPSTGFIHLSSATLRNALAHIDARS